MQVKVTYLSTTEAVVSVIADSAALQAIKDQVVQNLSANVKVAGFRSGKAPAQLVEKQLDPATLQSSFLESAIEQLYFQAVSGEKLRVVTSPQVSLKKFVPYTTLEFDATVPVVKEVKLGDYTKLKADQPKIEITAKDVSEILKNLQARVAERKPVDRAAKDGDEVMIDFKGTDAKSGDPINGADGENYPLLLGSNSFIPGFETNLIGLKPAEEKTFTLTFPADYGVKALANKKVTFAVTIKNVHEVVEPKLDDAFAAQVGPFETLQSLKDDIKKQLTAERQQEADRAYETALVKQIVDKSKVDIPAELIDDQIERIEQEEKQNLMYRGQTWQEHLAEEGVTEEEHKEQKRPAAEERVKTSLVLAEIADAEKLQVTPEEFEIRMQLLKGQYKDPAMLAELDKPENRRDIEAHMLTEKTLDVLRSKVA